MMNTMTFKTPWVRSSGWAKGLALLALAAAGWAASTGTAQARDNVYWSIGVNSPGVAVGVSNAPVYHQPYVIQHRPVIVHRAVSVRLRAAGGGGTRAGVLLPGSGLRPALGRPPRLAS